MAKNAPGPASAPSPDSGSTFDYSKYLPSDVKTSDLLFYEGLTPIYGAEEALAGGWEPVVGWVYGTEALKTLRSGTKDEYTPLMIRVCLTHPTKACSGTSDSRKTVDLQAGDDVMVPVNSSLKINKKLESACIDPKQVYLMIFRVTGKMKTDKPQDMWTWEVVDTTKRQSRTGKYALPSNEVLMFDLTTRQLTSDGSIVNGQTGEILKTGIPVTAGVGA